MRVAQLMKPIATTLLVAAAAACSADTTMTTKLARSTAQSSVSSPTLLECPTGQTLQGSGSVSPLGGVVSVGGTSISIPAGAVLSPTVITITIPASNYMEVDISAQGFSTFNFQAPVTVVLSYARCNRSDIDKAPLSAWYIDRTTKALIQNMGGSDDKVGRKVTFTTDHLTGYAVAN